MLVIACGPRSADVAAARGVELPVRPLCRQLLLTGPLELPADLPMVVEAETGFHFRRRGDRLVLAMTDAEPRWGFDEVVDESVFDDRLERLAHRYPPAARTTIDDAWAGLYDMTPTRTRSSAGSPTASTPRAASPGTASCRARRWGRPPQPSSSATSRRSTSPRTASSGSRGDAGFPGDARPLARYSNARPSRERFSSWKRPSAVASRSKTSITSGSLPISSRAREGTSCSAASADSQK